MSQFGPIAAGLFCDGGANIVITSSASAPLAGQVLTATSPTEANWQDISSILSAGLGIDAAQLALDNIQLETTARFTFAGNALELVPLTVPLGGTGVVTLTSNGVLIGQGAAAVNTAKQAPSGDFVGTTDIQTLGLKTVTDASNDVTGTGLFSSGATNTITVSGSAAPSTGDVLTATGPSAAEWQTPIVIALTAGSGIDATQLASGIIQLEVTARFTFSGNALELAAPVTVPFGGTGQTSLTNNGVLIGDGTNPVDTSKQAPTGDFVGTTDVQTLTNKFIAGSSNDVTASGLFSDSGANTIDVSAATNPETGQILIATSPTVAAWRYKYEAFFAYDNSGVVVVPSFSTRATMLFDVVVLNQNSSNYSYNAGTGVLTINDTGFYQFNICVSVATDGPGNTTIRSALFVVLERDTGGGFSTMPGSVSADYIRQEDLNQTTIYTATALFPLEVTVSSTDFRVRYFQNQDVDLLTRQNASRFNVKRIN